MSDNNVINVLSCIIDYLKKGIQIKFMFRNVYLSIIM